METGINIGLSGIGLEDQLDFAIRADEAGFSTIASLEADHDAFSVLAGAARTTRQARLFSGVATWVRPPLATARAARTLNEMSGGRFHLGLGTMPASRNRDLYGIDPSRPLARLAEYAEVVRGALTATSTYQHRGEFFEIRGYRIPPVQAGSDIPIHLGASRTGTARLAGETADGVLYNYVHTVDWIRDVLEPSVMEGEAVRGRRIERGVMLLTVIDDDEERALQHARRAFVHHVGVDYFHEIARRSGFDLSTTASLARQGQVSDAIAAVPDELIRSMAAVGTPEDCMQRVEALADLVDWVQLSPPRHVPPQVTRAGFEAIIDTFGS